MFSEINEVAVLVVALLSVAVEHVWYSPLLFGTLLNRSLHSGVVEEDASVWGTLRDTLVRVSMYGLLFVVILEIIQLLVVDISLLRGSSFLVLFVALVIGAQALRERRSPLYMAIHTGYIATILFGGMGILLYWPW